MREILTNLFLDLLEVNIVAAVVILSLSFLGGKLRKRYGSGWMKIMWILLAVRLLIPYNFSIVPLAGISFAGGCAVGQLECRNGRGCAFRSVPGGRRQQPAGYISRYSAKRCRPDDPWTAIQGKR